MTATDTHIDVHDDADEAAEWVDEGDALGIVTSNDHKSVGRLWIYASLFFLSGVSVIGVLNNIERISLGETTDLFGSIATYFQFWVLYRTGVVFLVALPMFIGIATVIVPLQVGSASIAFPRLAAAAFWSWLVAAVIHIISFFADGGLGPENGTLSESTLLTMVSLGFMIVAILAASICIATTIVALRPAGMTLLRVPAFTWSMLVATSVWLFSLPALIANLVFAYADLQGRDPIEFGQRDEIWSNVEWAWSQPQIYAYAIPVLGVLAEVVPVMSKHRQANRNVVLVLIGLFGFFSFGAWAQQALSRGSDPVFLEAGVGRFIYEEFLFIAVSLVIALPMIGILGGMADTIRRGSIPKINGPFLGALIGALLLFGGVIVGEIRAIPLWDGIANDDGVFLSSGTAQASLIVAALVASGVGALSYWSTKIFGGYGLDPLAVFATMALLVGGVVAGIADLVSSFAGQPDVSVAAVNNGTIEAMNVIATIGVALIAIGSVFGVLAVISAVRAFENLPDDPWDGHTLEWAAPSPPPLGNFVEPIEVVQSAEPLLDEFEGVN